ncbi:MULTISPECIES: alpha-E domain-containing protein [unclassified Arcicella]|uniref:alpha-E domain-containing protein n=1 Tax=unclassified Arcicella TaxID=2644986 RepID=UPI0028621A9B|nr:MULTISPECIES: alpha-E domain-containing protein [unclassified Arcicella]MDR6560325.1 putative alpha-E superfamily protein [Arcicella sp. BE51]MDR6810069.1 putative alpha-E superfamily protein [Arcicella sp. BE140]MDR6821418.1 putative alpha-E superfamily protein [Arcicella sp. BE139]
MLSRVANSIYWMNRYIERADNYARFISVNFNLALDLPPDVPEQWEPLIIATADNFIFQKHYDAPTRENVLYFMAFDVKNPNSILSCLLEARENARTIRESISREMWEYVNQIYWTVKDAAAESKSWELARYQGFLENIKTGSQLFYGIVDSTITRGEGWHFGRLGRLIERADKTTRFLDVKYFTLLPEIGAVGSPLDLMLWSSVLKSVSAYNMFRQQYQVMNPSAIVDFLLLDKKFPRSVMHCIRQAELSLYEISGTAITASYSNPAEKALSKLRSEVEFTEIKDIFDTGLHQYLDEFQQKNNAVGKAIFQTYFDLKPVINEEIPLNMVQQ